MYATYSCGFLWRDLDTIETYGFESIFTTDWSRSSNPTIFLSNICRVSPVGPAAIFHTWLIDYRRSSAKREKRSPNSRYQAATSRMPWTINWQRGLIDRCLRRSNARCWPPNSAQNIIFVVRVVAVASGHHYVEEIAGIYHLVEK